MNTIPASIESTFQDTRKPLLQFLKRRLGCSHTAEDLVQETYLRVVQHESIEEIADLRAFVFRIACNLAIDHGRQAVTRVQSLKEPLGEDLVCPNPPPDRVAEASQQLDILGQLIAELPPQCRRVFLLHRVQHLSHIEIAERLGISPRTVESQISKALRILRDRMCA
ncbi:MAG: sigma-70 family RNA polymerase sigma factor [Methylococcaceae bacterium]|nr:sigma-70 family RNA polymerase sigma factor [Methylococcaceae bacterium]